MEKTLFNELDRIKNRIDNQLNNVLCEMKEGYDDSVVGFNEAWDIVRAILKEEINAITR